VRLFTPDCNLVERFVSMFIAFFSHWLFVPPSDPGAPAEELRLDASVIFHAGTSQINEVILRSRFSTVHLAAQSRLSGCKPMSKTGGNCVLLANPHLGLIEGVHGLLATAFETVVMVADEGSLFDSARRLESDLAVVDLGLSRGNGLEMVRRLRNCFPEMKLIIISLHDQPSVSRAVIAAGANGFVAKRAIGADLLAATDAVLCGQRYVSPEVAQYRPEKSP
jgi:CheY-like chemotaxis protein